MVTNIMLIDIDGYRHNYKGFCENFIYLMPIKRGRTTDVMRWRSR